MLSPLWQLSDLGPDDSQGDWWLFSGYCHCLLNVLAVTESRTSGKRNTAWVAGEGTSWRGTPSPPRMSTLHTQFLGICGCLGVQAPSEGWGLRTWAGPQLGPGPRASC